MTAQPQNKIQNNKRHSYNSGIIGNCNYLAYIDNGANVAWMCWPRFDSSYIFGSLIDEKMGGQFSISPFAPKGYSVKQYYLPNTVVLCTEFESEEWHFRVIDFAPRFELHDRYFKPLQLMRKVEVLRGKPEVRIHCQPSEAYGKSNPSPVRGSNHISFKVDQHSVRLTSNASVNHLINNKSFLVVKDLYFCLSWDDHLEAPLYSTCEEFLQKTIRYWQKWVKRSSIPQVHQKEVIRSALTLKLHQYEDTGAIIASGTTSLPEHDKSGRNWDYRYCWPRDSYYTLRALNSISHFSELESYSHYLENLLVHDGHLQPVYAIDGSHNLKERVLDVSGYRGNQPVRIGNAAFEQVQYDIYGQILHGLLPLYMDERLTGMRGEPELSLIENLAKKIDASLDLKDAGIWEFRGSENHHLHTKLFHWLGGKVVQEIAKFRNASSLQKQGEDIVSRARDYIEDCWDEKEQFFHAAQDLKYTDASTLLMVNLGYLAPDSPRAASHVAAIYDQLKSPNGFLYRYKIDDDFGETVSSFLVCTFWYIEALLKIGRHEEAAALLEKTKQGANHVGLFSEDVEGEELSQWGNFPQTYSHVGFINCAFELNRLKSDW